MPLQYTSKFCGIPQNKVAGYSDSAEVDILVRDWRKAINRPMPAAKGWYKYKKDAIKSGEYGGRFTGELMLCERVSDLSRGLVT